MPSASQEAWHFPRGEPMCSLSSVGGEPRRWCCIESTPEVWDGLIVVGTKGGYIHALR